MSQIETIGAATLYLGDCLDILPGLVGVDGCLTDPPYGVKRDKGFEGFGGFGAPIARRRFENDEWDSARPAKEIFDLMLGKAKRVVIFGGNFFADILPQSTHWIVWDKLNTMPTFGDCELAWTNFDRKSVKKFTVEYNGLLGREDERFHPTQKPLKLMKLCVAHFGNDARTFLDPFMGSGTTGVAACEMRRKFIGIEREQKYFDIACKRIDQSQRQGDLLLDATNN